MNPLTVTWAPHVYKLGLENFQSWIHSGNDNYLMTPNGKVHRLLLDYQLIIISSFSTFYVWTKNTCSQNGFSF